MLFNSHSNLAGLHAFLSPSKHSWINYDEDKLARVFTTQQAAKLGDDLHDLACKLITLRVKLPKSNKTLNMYVNDAIGFRMNPEQPLKYSENAFGTCDAIAFRNNILRIHDLKTGITPASFDQLLIYAAFFCLEYQLKPHNIEMELRIYQNDLMTPLVPSPHDVQRIMDWTKRADELVTEMRMEALV